MSTIDVSELVFDDENEAKFAEHGVTVEAVAQVHLNGPRYRKNRAERRATHLMIGQTFGGRWLVIPIERWGSESGLWRPVTAFEPTATQLAQNAQVRRGK
jgi:uncharacterized DUF497 family protein